MERKKILIIDDDVDIQTTLSKRLQAHGFSCSSADSIDAGLKALENEHPHLIILDLSFQGANGTAFLQNAKKHVPADTQVPPILVLSCFNDKDIIEYVLNSGAVAFISKPYDPKNLIDTIQSHLSG